MLHPVPAEQLPPNGEGRRVEAGDKDIALFRVGENYYAVENVCPHAGAPIDDGYLEECVVSCPWHGWQFDVSTGKCVWMEGYDLDSFPVRVEDGQVSIEVGN